MASRAEFTLGQLAEALGATLEGDAARAVSYTHLTLPTILRV